MGWGSFNPFKSGAKIIKKAANFSVDLVKDPMNALSDSMGGGSPSALPGVPSYSDTAIQEAAKADKERIQKRRGREATFLYNQNNYQDATVARSNLLGR